MIATATHACTWMSELGFVNQITTMGAIARIGTVCDATSRSTPRSQALLTPAARSRGRSTATDAIRSVLTQALHSRHGTRTEADRGGAAGAPRADRRRERRAARRVDRHVGNGTRVP